MRACVLRSRECPVVLAAIEWSRLTFSLIRPPSRSPRKPASTSFIHPAPRDRWMTALPPWALYLLPPPPTSPPPLPPSPPPPFLPCPPLHPSLRGQARQQRQQRELRVQGRGRPQRRSTIRGSRASSSRSVFRFAASCGTALYLSTPPSPFSQYPPDPNPIIAGPRRGYAARLCRLFRLLAVSRRAHLHPASDLLSRHV